MLAVISVALFAVAAAAPESAKPQAAPVPKAPLVVSQQQYIPAAYPYQYQALPYYQQAGQYYTPYYHQAGQYYSGAYYQPQQYVLPQYQNTKFITKTAPVSPASHIITAAPAAPVAAPKPVLRDFNHPHPAQPIAILRQSLDDNFDGYFQYDFETENGISMASSGAVKQLSPEQKAQVIQGSYSYTTPEGQVITTTYVADENGFVASGDHLPQAPVEPELPPLIAKSLAYIRSLPPQPENQQ